MKDDAENEEISPEDGDLEDQNDEDADENEDLGEDENTEVNI